MTFRSTLGETVLSHLVRNFPSASFLTPYPLKILTLDAAKSKMFTLSLNNLSLHKSIRSAINVVVLKQYVLTIRIIKALCTII